VDSLFQLIQTRFGKRDNEYAFRGIKNDFEFELFGTGVDAGQTTFRCVMLMANWQNRCGTMGARSGVDVFPNT
jgi:hypothetical protein